MEVVTGASRSDAKGGENSRWLIIASTLRKKQILLFGRHDEQPGL